MSNYVIELINMGVYLGTKKNNWRPESAQFVSGFKNSVCIFNVSITNFYLSRALNFTEKTMRKGGRCFFFGLSNSNDFGIIKKLVAINQVVALKNWQGGYLSNTKFFKYAVTNFTKKFNFLVSLRLDYSNFPIVNESIRMKTPCICLVDSNSNPGYFIYPIPGNSSSVGGYVMFSRLFVSSIFIGIVQRSFAKRFARINVNNTKIRKFGKRQNRTAAVSFSGLYSTIELSSFY